MRQFSDTIYARKSKITQFSQDMVNGAANLSPLFINRELIMKTTILAAAAVLVSFAAPAMAWEGKVVACYDSVWVPAKTETHKNLHSAAHTKWEHRGGQLVEVYYAPVYIQHTHQKSKGCYLKVKAACNK